MTRQPTESDLDIIDLAIQAKFSEDILYQALTSAPSAKALLNSNKIAALIRRRFSDPKFALMATESVPHFPKAAMDRHPFLKEYRESFERAISMLKCKIAQEANDWAEYVIKERPALAIDLCTSELGYQLMAAAVDGLLNPDGPAGRKRAEKNRLKFYSRISSALARVVDGGSAGATASGDIGIALASEELYGGALPLVRYTLGIQYGHLLLFLTMASAGCDPDVLSEMSELADVDHDEFRFDVGEFSEIIDHLGPAALACAFGDSDTPYFVTDFCATSQTAIELLCQEIDSLIDAQASAARKAQEDEAALRDELRRQAILIESLQHSQGSETTRVLQEENAALLKDIQRLRGEIALRDERAARHAAVKQPKASREAAKPSAAAEKTTLPATGPSHADSVALLQGLKGVVIGGHTIFHTKLHALLPGWVCYDADEKGAEPAVVRNADLVVFHTNYLSHRLSEGVLKLARTNNIPVAYAYKVNLQAFVAEVAQFATTLPGSAPAR